MIDIKLENWYECKEELKGLLHAHWEEVAWYKDKMELDPIWDHYDKMFEANIFYPFIVRNDEKAIVGYALFFVHPGLHYKAHLVAENDIMYLLPEYRSKDLGFELLNYCQISFQSLGTSVMSVKMKTDNTFHSLMEHAGFSMMEFNYTKWIGD